MTHTTIGLDDIPTEVLIHIFDRSREEISTKSLLTLSISCKRLHSICLPMYLARYGIKNPLEQCAILLKGPQQTSDAIDALTGLRIAFFVPYVKDLICRFEVPGDVEDYLYVSAHLYRLHDFISSLSSISSVTLQFGNKRCGCCSELEPGQTLDEDLKKWSDAMASVLDLLLEKSCGEMIIVGGRFMSHTYVLKVGKKLGTIGHNTGTLAAIRRLLRKGKFANLGLPRSGEWINVLQGDHWEFRRDLETGQSIILTSLSKSAQTTSILKSLTISSRMFGIPPLLHWMISVLRLPTVESLTLHDLPMSRREWIIILSLISEHCSHLTELKFSRLRQLNARELLQFIGKFPNLSSLHLERIEFYNDDNLGLFPVFPRLKTLHAPAPWLFEILTSQPTGLPALETISISYRYSKGTVTQWLKTPPDQSIPTLLQNSPLLSSISLKMTLGESPGFRMLEDTKTSAQDEPGVLKNVNRINLRIDYGTRVGDMELKRVIPDWLAKFHGLRHLSIKAIPNAKGMPNALSDAEVSMLAMLIVREGKSPLLESFEANGVKIDLHPR